MIFDKSSSLRQFDYGNFLMYAFVFIAVFAFVGQIFFTIDDLFIDLCATFLNLKPKVLSESQLRELKALPQKRIAIMIANWQEDEILAQIVSGNVHHLQYAQYTIFLGVYPNDLKTWTVANKLTQLYPTQVQVIVNSLPGPTSKGQMLNEMVRRIVESQSHGVAAFDLYMLHDSEDVIHPLSLYLINFAAEDAHFIQLPVFSFDLNITRFVGGTYIEEFGESHTKDLLVREKLGAAIPSAGVGTAITRELVIQMMKINNGQLLKEDTLTEDYHLGITAKTLGFRSRFLAYYLGAVSGAKNIIATREYFPNHFWSSVKQKTRWTLGIVFQGRENIGWTGTLVDCYFLMRDRKGPLNFILFILGTITLAGFLISWVFDIPLHPLLVSRFFLALALINFFSMLLRMIQRMRAVQFVYSNWKQTMMVPVRWPIGNVINGLAAYRAFRSYRAFRGTAVIIPWSKTVHEIPKDFGQNIGTADPIPDTDKNQPQEVLS